MVLPRLEDAEKRAGLLIRLMVSVRFKLPIGHLGKGVTESCRYVPKIWGRDTNTNDHKSWGTSISLVSKYLGKFSRQHSKH